MKLPKRKPPRWAFMVVGCFVIFGAFRPLSAVAVEPCCSISAIDARTGVVSAKEAATGRTFQFKLNDTALLASLKVGQIVEADFATGVVNVHPAQAEPTHNIAGRMIRPAEPVGVRR